ncbi:MAG: ArsC/Spx/MgsR family protein [Pseudomonadota bacterium]
MKLTVTGLKNCDTCKKAIKSLNAAGFSPVFVDIRGEADLSVLVPLWLDAVGEEQLINKRSTTWRHLPEVERSKDPSTLLQLHPTLIKRPVIETAETVYVGWTKDTQAALLKNQ